MEDMCICGSCHTLVTPLKGATKCPRCQEDLEPDAAALLRKFIETGIIESNRKGGITIREAQKAANEVLGELQHTHAKLKLHHVGSECSDCTKEEHKLRDLFKKEN